MEKPLIKRSNVQGVTRKRQPRVALSLSSETVSIMDRYVTDLGVYTRSEMVTIIFRILSDDDCRETILGKILK